MTKIKNKDFSSFRDPAGYIYYENNKVYRKINQCYFLQYNHLIDSKLYDELKTQGYLISHKEVKNTNKEIILEVEKVPFISYPYEWCFEELKDAALLTLNICKKSLEYGMILKDASSYNIQFFNGKPIFIDTLSFDFYEDGMPWGAYGQFCRHFMVPLILMSYVDENLNCMLKNYIDGIPVEIANNILKGRGGFAAKQHIKWHSRSISKYNDNKNEIKKVSVSKQSLINMIDMMIRQIEKLKTKHIDTEWGTYYDNTNYTDIADKTKIKLVDNYLKKINIGDNDVVFDLGANDGKYSRLAAKNGAYTISFDIDINAVGHNYQNVKVNNETKILPLILDCTNPSPDLGFALEERLGITKRGNRKCVMALAFIHHMAISNNVSFDMIANWFSKLGEYLIIEFVPKSDSQVQKLLKTRQDIFNHYNEKDFEDIFKDYFEIVEKKKIDDSKRTLYLMWVKNENEK